VKDGKMGRDRGRNKGNEKREEKGRERRERRWPLQTHFRSANVAPTMATPLTITF